MQPARNDIEPCAWLCHVSLLLRPAPPETPDNVASRRSTFFLVSFPGLREMIGQQNEVQENVASLELARETERQQLGLTKLRKFFLDDIEVENIELFGFKSDKHVSSFRTTKLPKNLQVGWGHHSWFLVKQLGLGLGLVWLAQTKVPCLDHASSLRLCLQVVASVVARYLFNASFACDRPGCRASHPPFRQGGSQALVLLYRVSRVIHVPEAFPALLLSQGELRNLLQEDDSKAMGGRSLKTQPTKTTLVAPVEEEEEEVAMPREPVRTFPPPPVPSDPNETKYIQKMEAKRRRQQEWADFNFTKPSDARENEADVAAITEAEKTVGDYKLKSDRSVADAGSIIVNAVLRAMPSKALSSRNALSLD